jgi:hypothetical protein
MTDAPYQVKTVTGGNAKYFRLVDTRTEDTIDESLSRWWLEEMRNTLNTDWFFNKYV